MRRALSATLLCAIILLYSSSSATTAAAAGAGSSQAIAFEQVLVRDPAVRAAIGSSFDILRIEPVSYRPGQFVVDAAAPDRTRGVRVLVNGATARIVRLQRLSPPDILFTSDDVERAFDLVKTQPAIRARLGATLGLYRASDSSDAVKPAYRVDALPVRGADPRDYVMILGDCSTFAFATPQRR